jgi:integrase
LVAKSAIKAAMLATYGISPAQRQAINEGFKTIKVGKIDSKPSNREFLAKDTISAVAAQMPPKWALWVRFTYITGLRVSEALSVRKDDITISGDNVFIKVIGKGNKQRETFCPLDLYLEILNHWQDAIYLFGKGNGTTFTRQYAYILITNAGNAIGIKIHPHSLRHSLASQLVENGEAIHNVSTYLGHSNSQITIDFYLHNKPSVSKLRQAII